MNAGGRIVYSTDGRSKCLDCGRSAGKCRCKNTQAPKSDGIVRVSRQTKGRKGKGVTIITGVPLVGAELKALAKTLKARCGSGGTVKDGTIEIQGDHRDLVIALLTDRDFTVKRAGG